MKFLTPLRVEQAGKARWRLTADLVYWSDLLGRAIHVPAGFETDFASVPRLPFTYLFAGGKASAAAVIHDWLYSTHELDRSSADAVFREAIEAEGHGWFTRWLMWAGVRVGGGWAWPKDKNLEQPAHVEQRFWERDNAA